MVAPALQQMWVLISSLTGLRFLCVFSAQIKKPKAESLIPMGKSDSAPNPYAEKSHMLVKRSYLLLLAIPMVICGCSQADYQYPSSQGSASSYRMHEYVRSTQSGLATTLLMSPNDPLPTDKSLIDQNIQAYERRGYDAKKAERCAREDFISATGRFPSSGF